MKITIKHLGVTHSVETEQEHLTATETLDIFCNLNASSRIPRRVNTKSKRDMKIEIKNLSEFIPALEDCFVEMYVKRLDSLRITITYKDSKVQNYFNQ
jgi:hypothetical protein